MRVKRRQPVDYVLNKTVVDEQKALRDDTDMELAEVCGVHPATFSRWLNGRFPLPLGAALALEDYWNLPIRKFTRQLERPAEARRAS